jgi:hypothetical protein
MRGVVERAVLLVVVALAAAGTMGCTYLRYREQDLADVVEIGVTYSRSPQWAFYHSILSTIVLGYADSETTFYGLADGRFGRQPQYVKAWGAVAWGKEQIGWGNYRKDDPSTLYCQTVGLVGMPTGVVTGHANPHYVPT